LYVIFAAFSLGVLWGDTLVMKDGTTHEGTVVSTTATHVSFRENGVLHHYARTDITSIQFGTPSGNSSELGTAARNQTTESERSSSLSHSRSAVLPVGSQITVMTNEPIDSSSARENQTYTADVADNVMNSAGQVVIPKGSEAELVVRRVSTAGTVTGSNDLALDLQSVKVNGRRYMVSTEDVNQAGNAGIGKNKRTAEMVGGGAVLGTLIGAVAGGGKGAAIGALGGAAAGGATQVLTRGKTVKVPAESKLTFRLDQPLHLEAAY
jgi:hypothetical protein